MLSCVGIWSCYGSHGWAGGVSPQLLVDETDSIVSQDVSGAQIVVDGKGPELAILSLWAQSFP